MLILCLKLYNVIVLLFLQFYTLTYFTMLFLVGIILYRHLIKIFETHKKEKSWFIKEQTLTEQGRKSLNYLTNCSDRQERWVSLV